VSNGSNGERAGVDMRQSNPISIAGGGGGSYTGGRGFYAAQPSDASWSEWSTLQVPPRPTRSRSSRPTLRTVSCVVLCAGAQVLAGVVVRGQAAIPERGRGGELVLGFGVERHIRVQPVVDALPGLLLLPALPASPATGTSSIPRNYFNLFKRSK
jgi:hypothetical protein